jgi:hypothetical protein
MTSFLIRGLSAFAFAAATLGLGATARAQTFPSKPIRIVVPFARCYTFRPSNPSRSKP